MTAPDSSTVLVLLVNAAGWVVSIWRNSIFRYQHKAMWEEYAEKKGIPVNGKG